MRRVLLTQDVIPGFVITGAGVSIANGTSEVIHVTVEIGEDYDEDSACFDDDSG